MKATTVTSTLPDIQVTMTYREALSLLDLRGGISTSLMRSAHECSSNRAESDSDFLVATFDALSSALNQAVQNHQKPIVCSWCES